MEEDKIFKKKSIKNKIGIGLLVIVCFFCIFTIFLYAPYEIFLLNNSNFGFGFADIWIIIAFFAMIVYAVLFLLGFVLRGKVREYYCVLMFAGTLCVYIQTMFLNGEMYSLVGNNQNWKTSTVIVNALIWILIVVACFALRGYAKKYWEKIFSFLAVAIVLMQATGLLSLLLTQELEGGNSGYLSEEGMFELSSEENVVYFVVDYFDGTFMEAILSEDEAFLEPLTGFTYFPNATGTHSRTYPSLPYLLTGEKCYFDVTTKEYTDNAYANSTYWADLVEENVDIGLYTYGEYLGEAAKPDVSNYVSAKLKPDEKEVIKGMLKMSLYRSAPYCIKNVFQYDADKINNYILSSDKNQAGKFQNFEDNLFYENLQSGIRLTEEEKVFRLYHLGSCHLDLTNPLPHGKFSMEIVFEYIEQLKKLGIYDKTTIIITADHGSSGGGETLDLPQGTAVPLIIVKPKAAGEEKLQVSDAPVCQEDLFATVLAGFDCQNDDFSEEVFDFEEGEVRERYYYYTALYSDEEGEVELREYVINGDAREEESYRFTGKSWPVLYSYNTVSR